MIIKISVLIVIFVLFLLVITQVIVPLLSKGEVKLFWLFLDTDGGSSGLSTEELLSNLEDILEKESEQ